MTEILTKDRSNIDRNIFFVHRRLKNYHSIILGSINHLSDLCLITASSSICTILKFQFEI
ncbi:hypothetical protein BpHYR1_007898 [Brachionus plicatilis]|uniref:Uncharacterized protein n=1 Tax=Brachionus plicatilis TaxID=10195 RepID=A0A3M7QJ96_BRAPC|nr:hypothetical protein BpHYR1_007898 [Brachionus plicatilis]